MIVLFACCEWKLLFAECNQGGWCGRGSGSAGDDDDDLELVEEGGMMFFLCAIRSIPRLVMLTTMLSNPHAQNGESHVR